jgi:lipopolysaccharide transport system ATP-binding protein
MKPIIKVENLSKRFLIGGQKSHTQLKEYLDDLARSSVKYFTRRNGVEKTGFWALQNVNFEVKPGDVLGIIGRNGSGKSTLLKIISRITAPTKGRVELYGRIGSLLEVGTGFHPDLTGRENIFLNGAILGMRRQEISRKFDEIVDFAEIEKFLDTPVKHYSSGMYMRLAFAVAAHLEPEILIIDEVLSVGDIKFQKKCLGKMEKVNKEGRTVLFVSHDMATVRHLCRSAILLDKGVIASAGEADDVISQYVEMNEKPFDKTVINEHGIELSNIQLQDFKTGDVTSSPIFNRSYELKLQFEAYQPHDNVVIYCYLYDNLGNLISVTSSSEEGVDPFYLNGLSKVSFHLPRLQLFPGTYHVSVVVYGYFEEKKYFDADRCLTFEIQPAVVHNAANAYNKKYAGIVRVSDGCQISSENLSKKSEFYPDQVST